LLGDLFGSARGRYFGSDKFLDPVRPYRSFSSARSRPFYLHGRKCSGRNAEIRKKRARGPRLRLAKWKHAECRAFDSVIFCTLRRSRARVRPTIASGQHPSADPQAPLVCDTCDYRAPTRKRERERKRIEFPASPSFFNIDLLYPQDRNRETMDQ